MTGLRSSRIRAAAAAVAGAPALTAAGVAVFAHAAALGNALVFDDYAAVKDSADLRTFSGLVRLASQWQPRPESDPGASPVFRPVASALDWLSWQLLRSSAPAQHAVNIALHAAACFLLVRLLVSLDLRWPARWLGIIFAAHPVTAFAVAPLAGRAVLLGALLVLATIVALRKRASLPAQVIIAALGSAAAVLSHEAFACAPAIIALAGLERGRGKHAIAAFLAGLAVVLVAVPASRSTTPVPAGALVIAVATVVARFASVVAVPTEPVLAFTPEASGSAWSITVVIVAGLVLAAGPVFLARRRAPAYAVAGAGAVLAFGYCLGLAPAAVRGNIASDRGAYVVLLGLVLVGAALLREYKPEPGEPSLVSLLPLAGALVLAPLNAAHARAFRDEETALRSTAEARDGEGRLARALLAAPEQPAEDATFCADYAASRRSTRAHGCLARALLRDGRTHEALAPARAYAAERINRPAPRRLLIETLIATGNLDEARALVASLSRRYPTSPDLAWARQAVAP